MYLTELTSRVFLDKHRFGKYNYYVNRPLVRLFGNDMEAIEYEGIEVDRCKTCQEIWFDVGESDSLCDRDAPAEYLMYLSNRPLPANCGCANRTLRRCQQRATLSL